ncbi:SRBS1 protein, partial [Crypturellus undulatus]|nr:SRBS1 protein [Crypturellus undulatus]
DTDPSKVCSGKGAVTLRASPASEENQNISSPPCPQDVEQRESRCCGFFFSVDDCRSSSSNTDANGDAQPSSLAAKGYRSVRPNLSTDSKPQVSPFVTLRVIFWVQALDSWSEVSPGSNSKLYCRLGNIRAHTSGRRMSSVLTASRISPKVQECKAAMSKEASGPCNAATSARKRLLCSVHGFMSYSFSPLNLSSLRRNKKSLWCFFFRGLFSSLAKCFCFSDEDSDSYSPRYSYSEDTRTQPSVPRSRSEMDNIDSEKVFKRSATLPLPARTSSLKSTPERTDWEPPDKKVDTRKYRAEPRSIYDYQPGKSSVLNNEKMTRDISPEEIDLKNEPWYKFFSELEFGKPTDLEKDLYLYQTELEADLEKMEKLYKAPDKKLQKNTAGVAPLETSTDRSSYYQAVKRESEFVPGDPAALENERQIYKSVLEGGDIPLQGLSGLKRPSSSASTKVDRKGGNAHMTAPSSVSSRTFNASHTGMLGHACKHKKPLSAAKACITEILPSKFKPKLAAPAALVQDKKGILLSHEKAQSCENLRSSVALFDNKKAFMVDIGEGIENMLMKSKQEYAIKSGSTMSLQEYGTSSGKGYLFPASRKSGMEFTMLYKDMHQINRSRIHLDTASSCSVRDIASQFENEAKDRMEHSLSQGNSEQIPKHTVSSRISAFEQLIQRSRSMPSLDFSIGQGKFLTSLQSKTCLSSAYSAESVLDLPKPLQEEKDAASLADKSSRSCSNVEDTASDVSDAIPMDTLSACTDEIDLLSNASNDSGGSSSNLNGPQKYKINRCKGTCPASYTRFTTIRRHEQQQSSRNPDRKGDVYGDRPMLPRNVYLMSPLPFRLKKPFHHNARRTPPLDCPGTPSAPNPESPNDPVQLQGSVGDKGHHSQHGPCFQRRPLAPERLSSLDIVGKLGHFPAMGCGRESFLGRAAAPDSFNNGNPVPFALYPSLDTNNNPQSEL